MHSSPLRLPFARVAGVLAVGFAFGCGGGDDPTSPTITDVAGSYEATSFTTSTLGMTTNELAEGSNASLLLRPDGTAQGDIYVASLNSAEAFTGTWRLERNVVQIDTPADVIFDDLDFTVQGRTLTADESFGLTRVRMTLTKQ